MELSRASGFLREYVETGDETRLIYLFLVVYLFFTQENYAHWQNIRTLRQALPAGESLRLIDLGAPTAVGPPVSVASDGPRQISGLSTTKLANIAGCSRESSAGTTLGLPFCGRTALGAGNNRYRTHWEGWWMSLS